jgi:hypothetical protein
MKAGDVVLVDTNVILEAHAKACWKALAGAYALHTVEPCIEETQTGALNRPADQRIDEAELRKSFKGIHEVSMAELAEVAVRGGAGLDPGERALWAHALARTDVWVLCGPDRASMRFGYEQKQRERLVSMGGLLNQIKFSRPQPLRPHFEQEWLDDVINKLVLGIL